MPYNASGAALLHRIQDAGYRDEATGSKFAALERRGLVICKYEPGSLGGPILFVQITKAGRKMVREALNVKAPKSLPVGTLREWHWRALCRVMYVVSRVCPMIAIWATDSGMSVGIAACDYGTTRSKGRSAD